ncbi:DUF4190 domain-containing protein [Amycolatopsis sp. PS_44_ISF1]|uniref:DUF4190 domain-containing protein n=1 Tax=Amycolatopsis sp. PS_44_ISF1 TaxID=2974917 RepID=UPI0028DD9359|nr:DUF4190 domain-containing protein [Amycolatopsis sp. PS_44_ISF1]MDT8912834.1 DUF4190 domain-containing protein [Amycolatopsis sp. PS_44_ISF1]
MTSHQPHPPASGYSVPVIPRNGLGTAGFVTGLIGLIFSPIPFVGVIAWPLVLVGLVLSIVGFARANHGGATNKGLALTGIILSGIGLLVCIFWVAAFGQAVSDSASTPPAAPAAVSPGAAAAQGQAAAEHTVVYRITGTGKASSISYTVDGGTSTSSDSDVKLPWQKSIELPGGKAFQLVSILAQGGGSGSIHVSVEVDGKVLKEADASGYGVATANATVGAIGD